MQTIVLCLNSKPLKILMVPFANMSNDINPNPLGIFCTIIVRTDLQLRLNMEDMCYRCKFAMDSLAKNGQRCSLNLILQTAVLVINQ